MKNYYPNSPCEHCSKKDICGRGCDYWKEWFSKAWRETQALFGVKTEVGK